MNLIKIGNRFINLDNVTEIGPVNKDHVGGKNVLQIEYIGESNEDWGSCWVEDEEAGALLTYLAAHSTDVQAAVNLLRATKNVADDRAT